MSQFSYHQVKTHKVKGIIEKQCILVPIPILFLNYVLYRTCSFFGNNTVVIVLFGLVLAYGCFIVCLQGEEHSSQAVSRLPGGTGHSAGVGQWGAPTADNQPGCQLCLRPVRSYTQRFACIYNRNVTAYQCGALVS